MKLEREVSAAVLAFLDHMVDDEGWTTTDLVYFLEKPWKWQPEFDAWQARQPSEA